MGLISLEAKSPADSTITKPDGRPRSWRVGAPRSAAQIDEPLAVQRPTPTVPSNHGNPNVFQDVSSAAIANNVATPRSIQSAVVPTSQNPTRANSPAPVAVASNPNNTFAQQGNARRERSAAELFPRTTPINRNVYQNQGLQPLAVPQLRLTPADEFRKQFVSNATVTAANAPKVETRVGFFGVEQLTVAEQNDLISQIGGLNRTILGIPIEKAKVEIRSTGLLTVYSDGVAVRRYLLQNFQNLPKTPQLLMIGSKGVNRRFALNIGFRGANQEDLQLLESTGLLTRDERQILKNKIDENAAYQNQFVLVGTNVEPANRPYNALGIDQMDLDEIYRILTVGTPVFFLP